MAYITTRWSSNVLEITILYSIHCLIPAILLIATAKRSVLRHLSIPCLVFIAHRSVKVATALGPGFLWCELARLVITVVFQALNLLILNPIDASDLPEDKDHGIVTRVYSATRLFTQPRGINTPWQIKNVPAHPAYYIRRNLVGPPRGRFLLRQTAILIWQYLALDVFATVALQQALEQRKHELLPRTVQWDLSTEEWIERIISNLIAGFVVSRMLIDMYHRAFSVFIVGIGLDLPANCPPLYGRAADAGTLRGFWGKFWHQLVRQPFASVSAFITREILRLPHKSLLERYANVIFVFLFSGGLHVVLDIVQGIPGEESGAMLLFMSAPLGLLIEDGIKTLWKYFFEPKDKARTPQNKPNASPVWQRVIGFGWTMAWASVTATWYFYPQMLRPENQNLVPFSVASVVGLPILGGVVLIWGVIVAYVFEIEI